MVQEKMGSDTCNFGPGVTPDSKGWEIRRSSKAAGQVWTGAVLFFLCILLGLLGPSVCRAQNKGNKVEFLIARRQIQDPFFEHSVVFMLPQPEAPLIVGLIINKPTRVTLGRLFPKTPAFRGQTEPAYFGGPVDVRIPSVVFRSPSTPEHALHLYGNVYLTFDSNLITKLFRNSKVASGPRMFLGRAQWAPGQLQNEILRGGWYRLQADGDLIFTRTPKNLWLTLHQQAEPSKYIQYKLPSGGPQPSTRKTAVM